VPEACAGRRAKGDLTRDDRARHGAPKPSKPARRRRAGQSDAANAHRPGEVDLKAEEIRKLDAYFKRTFQNPSLAVKARPRKDDSCELYVGDEFLGIIFKDDEDGELSYNFSMAILDVDL